MVAAAGSTLLCLALFGSFTQAFAPADAAASDDGRVHDYFWGVGCPHCEEARPFAESLKDSYSDFEHRWYEVKKDENGRKVFKRKVKELKIKNPGIPAFICDDRYVIGFTKGKTEGQVRAMLDACRAAAK